MLTTIDLVTLLVRVVVGGIFIAQGYVKLLRPPDAPHGRANLEAMIRRRGIPRRTSWRSWSPPSSSCVAPRSRRVF